jgi:adenosine kinase
MHLVLTGSIAFDYLMTFPGKFRDHILVDRLDRISLSFLVDSLVRRRGGIAANIAYTLALLGEQPTVMATVGEDFADYAALLTDLGVDLSGIRVIPDEFTASFFVNTDQNNAQIASFFTGAMSYARELSFADLERPADLAVISANDPDAMQSYVRQCREQGIPYIYDPSQQTVRADADTLIEGIETCKALFVNDYEFGLIEEKTGLTMDDIQRGSEFVVVTCGEDGADIHTNSGPIHIPAVAPDEIRDPTGVGDAFRAGFLKGHLHGLGLERCGQMGAVASAYCLENQGPQGHSFDRRAFVERFRSHFDDQGELEGI